MQQPSNIVGWGVDAALENRPGVPEELPPHPIGYASLGGPVQQTVGRPTAKSVDRPITPVYGTTCPERGLSGVIRRVAYKTPDYKARHWMLLLLADRVDAIEHNPFPMLVVAGGIFVASALGLRALVRSR